MPPKTVAQQLGSQMRERVYSLGAMTTRVHQMSVPIGKLDNPPPHDLPKGLLKDQERWPNNAIGTFAYLEQDPNADGKNSYYYADTPKLHLCVAESTQITDALLSAICPAKDKNGQDKCEIVVHHKFESWAGALEKKDNKKNPNKQPVGSKRNKKYKVLALPKKGSKLNEAAHATNREEAQDLQHAIGASLATKQAEKKKLARKDIVEARKKRRR